MKISLDKGVIVKYIPSYKKLKIAALIKLGVTWKDKIVKFCKRYNHIAMFLLKKLSFDNTQALPVILIGVFVILGNLFVSSLYDMPYSGIMLPDEQRSLAGNITDSVKGSLLATAKAEEIFTDTQIKSISTLPPLVTEKSVFDTATLDRAGRASTPTVRPTSYTVAMGDTLSGIGLMFDLKIATLKYSNNLTSESIKPGQKLKIPAADLSDKQIAKIKSDNAKKVASSKSSSKPKVFLASDDEGSVSSGDSSSLILPITSYKYVSRAVGHGHQGIDYVAPTGTTIISPCDGVVSDVGPWGKYSGGRGNYVYVRCSSGIQVGLFHMSAYSSQAVPGNAVSAGTAVGQVGSTGNSTGSHLHAQFSSGGGVFDPGLR